MLNRGFDKDLIVWVGNNAAAVSFGQLLKRIRDAMEVSLGKFCQV